MGLFNRLLQEQQGRAIEYNQFRKDKKHDVDTKGMFVSNILKEDAELILSLQLKAVKKYGLFDEGKLERSLIHKAFGVAEDGTGKRLTIRYVKYLRHLDMYDIRRKRHQYHLYNRIVFGIIYNRTIGKLIYGYTDEIKQQLAGEINS